MIFKRILITIIIISGLSIGLQAQRHYYFTEQWSIGLGFGATTFYGDLTDKTNRFFSNTPFSKYFYQDRHGMAVMILEKKVNVYYGFRGHLSYGRLISTQESTKQYFRSNIGEYSFSGVFDFTNIFMGQDRYRLWSIYGHVGIGFTESRTWKFNIQTGKLVGTNGFGSPKRDGGNYIPMTETVFPMGLGFKYQFSKYSNVWIELALHPIRTDKLDATLSDDKWMEGYGLIMAGASYQFALPDHWQVGNRYPRYNGKSTDPAIKLYNKRKRVVMNSKGYKKGIKSKKKFKTKRKKSVLRR